MSLKTDNNLWKAEGKLAGLLGRSKWISLLGVVVLYISSGILIIIGLIELFYIIDELFDELKLNQVDHTSRINTLLFSARFLHIIEIYLLAIIFYIFAVGIYKLFVGKFVLLAWYQIESLDEMKIELAKAIVVFLSVFMVQRIVGLKEPENFLYVGGAVALTCANLIWYIKSHNPKNHQPKNKE